MEYRNLGAVIEETIRVQRLKELFKILGSKEVLIDLGCGPRPYHSIYKPYFQQTMGIEHPDSPFPKKDIDLFCEATNIPLEANYADVILCTEMLHDAAEPAAVLKEVTRLLKPGGSLILTTPFLVPIVDGNFDHYRYTKQGLIYLVNNAELSLTSVEPVSDIFGAGICLFIKPWLRIWNQLAKKTGIKWIYTRFNPLLWVTVLLPQLGYLVLMELPGFKQFFKKFSYGSIGYITVAIKPIISGSK